MSLRQYILPNFWLKVFSLVLAVLIWLVIQANFQTEGRPPQAPLRPGIAKDFRRPVFVITSAANRQLFQVDPTEVTVKVRGDPTLLEQVDPEEIRVTVKLVDVPQPEGSFVVAVDLPRDLTLQQVWPAHVYVKPLETAPSE